MMQGTPTFMEAAVRLEVNRPIRQRARVPEVPQTYALPQHPARRLRYCWAAKHDVGVRLRSL